MGAWGAGSFDNDEALDWYEDFRATGADAIGAALDATRTDESVDADDGCAALAAAEIVAACFGLPPADRPADLDELVSRHAAAITALPDIRRRAIAAVSRVRSETSELFELWHEDNNPSAREWLDIVDNLIKRLEAAR